MRKILLRETGKPPQEKKEKKKRRGEKGREKKKVLTLILTSSQYILTKILFIMSTGRGIRSNVTSGV